MVSRMTIYEEGGPNDPRTTFNGLRDWLSAVKEELSPWGWMAYTAEFRERMQAEKKLQAMNSLSGSGAEPEDGVIQGTPLWQERLDQMLLVEHLKRKVMVAHTAFAEAQDLMLQAHAWLVKDSLLADKFAECISRVPPSQHDRIDLLQGALKQLREDLRKAQEEFNEYKVLQMVQRQEFLARTTEHQNFSIPHKRKDDIMVAWRYAAERTRAQDLESANIALIERVSSLETAMTTGQEDLEEASRQWDEQRTALEAERNEYKRLYEKFLRAHEQAMADLEQSQGTAEDQAKMLQVLTVEKHRLTQEVEELQDDKKRMAKQLAELRDEVAKLKAELRRLGGQLREAEKALLAARQEGQQLRADCKGLQDVMDKEGEGEGRPSQRRLLLECAKREAELLDRMRALERTCTAQRNRLYAIEGPPGSESITGLAPASQIGVLVHERRLRGAMENERDALLTFTRDLDRELIKVKEDAYKTVMEVKNKAAKELYEFKTFEIAKIRADFQYKMDILQRQNDILNAEVAVGDAIGPHLPTLNALGSVQDPEKMCSMCRRAIVFEGSFKK